jgi:hypothetical protein
MDFLLTPQAIERFATLISVVATVLGGAAASGLFEKVSRGIARHYQKDKHLPSLVTMSNVGDRSFQDGVSVSDGITAVNTSGLFNRLNLAKTHVLVRLTETRNANLKQLRLARWARWSSNLLTFSQYVLGGVMATSFIQKQLSPEAIGVFGVLVIAASLVKQHYHPEIDRQNASQKANQLEALVRQSEDRLVVIETTAEPGAYNPGPLLDLLERVSSELTRITASPTELLQSSNPQPQSQA